MDFTFLKEEQIWGDGALEVMKRYGTKVVPTDLALILGGSVYRGEDFTSEGDLTCISWTASSDLGDFVCTVCSDGQKRGEQAIRRATSARPVLPPSEASKISPSKLRNIDGIWVAEYGEYPQTVADERTSERLEEMLFSSGSLRMTGKNYFFDSVGLTDYDRAFEGRAFHEYEMDGKRYIRVLGRPADGGRSKLSTGELVEDWKPYWVQVQPVEWLMDESGTMIAKKCLFAGIQFDTRRGYDGDFSKTFMKHYLDNYFARELEPVERMVSREFSRGSEKIKAKEKKESTDRALSRDSEETEAKEPVKKKEPTARQKKYGIVVSDEPMPVKDQINFYIQNGMSFMLHGPSGVGKSQRVKDIDPDLTSITLCNGILPEDVIGKTIYPNGVGADGASGGVWVPPKWYTDLCRKCETEPDKQHVLFIDEVTNARETTQSLIYHVALEKSIAQGVGKLPNNAVVVLAGNSKEESGAAYSMPAPLFRRLSHIYLDLNIQDWLEWGSEHSKSHPEDPDRLNIHPLVASFVATYGQQVFYSEYNEENPGKFALDPRKWEKVSDKIYANKGVMRREILEADIGHELAASLLFYAKNPPLSLEEVIEGEYTHEDIPEGQDARLALALSLRHVTPKQVAKVRQFIESQLGLEIRATFDSIWIGKDDARAVQIAGLSSLHNLNTNEGR